MSKFSSPYSSVLQLSVPPAKDNQTLLTERGRTHGEFRRVAAIAQALKEVLRRQPEWATKTVIQRESLDCIATKCARIMSGDADFQDHHDDIDGYAALAGR